MSKRSSLSFPLADVYKRQVQKAKGERGVPLTVNVPYGSVKDPENPKHWLVDPEAAAIVKRIRCV